MGQSVTFGTKEQKRKVTFWDHYIGGAISPLALTFEGTNNLVGPGTFRLNQYKGFTGKAVTISWVFVVKVYT